MVKILHTIGYEGSTIDDFLATLEAAGIDHVLDIRDVPVSRKAGFSKSRLSVALAARDIGYDHLKSLGDPKPGREAARAGRYDEFRRIFRQHMQSEVAQGGLLAALDAANIKSACLLCYERDHHGCHRCIVADELERRGQFRIVHLGVRAGLSKQPVGGARQGYAGDFVCVG